ncbi:MAG: MBL fold metallo-hydrolase [archaeon]
MTNITFHGGANEIGGNKILLEEDKTKLYLDFGESFNFGEEYFYEYLQPRTVNGLEVMFEFDLMPRTSNLYSEKALQFADMKYEKPDVDGVLISHSHSDHIGHLKYLDESIPVHMGHGTYRLCEAYAKLFPQFGKLGEHGMKLFKTGDKFNVKNLEVEPVHVEHSAPASYGYIIKTKTGPLVYTGDFRLHGPTDLTDDFIKEASKSKPHVMLCEGTRMGREEDKNYTETEVQGKIEGIIENAKESVFAYSSMLNLDRVMSLYNAAKKTSRRLVIDTRLAYIIDSMRDKMKVLPNPLEDDNIDVYFRMAKSCKFCEKDYSPWAREYMDKMVSYKDLRKSPKEYIMHLGFYRLIELVYIKPKRGDFIFSQSEHFFEGEENKEQKQVWENWMEHYNIEFHKAHCSGHASKDDIESTIKKIKPDVLVPIHTDNAEAFKEIHDNVIIPEKGKRVEV